MTRKCLFVCVFYLLNTVGNAKTELDTIESNCIRRYDLEIEEYDSSVDEIKVPTEEQIGMRRNMYGIQPMRYELKLRFENGTHYNGKVYIWMRVVQRTKHIMVNVKQYSPTLNSKRISVSIQLEDNTFDDVCINRIFRMTDAETLVIELIHELPVGIACLVTFGYFTSFPINEHTGRGAEGLRVSNEANSSVLYTIFQTRLARSVFPCMDHPALKATFQLTIEFPNEYTVASNTQPDAESYQLVGTNLRRQLFKETPKISTYNFAFVLMHNYEKFSDERFPKLQLWARQNDTAKYQWVMPEAHKAYNYLQSINKFQMPIEKLSFVLAGWFRYDGRSNLGLITLNSHEITANSSRKALGLLFREIAHLWIGNVVTVRVWNEHSLQESFAIYIRQFMLEQFTGVSVSEMVINAMRFRNYFPYSSFLGECTTLKETVSCYCQGPLVFRMFTHIYGAESIELFLSNLVNAYALENAGLEEWNNVLPIAFPDASATLKSYLKRWFLEPGPLTLIIRSDNNSTVTITQNLTDQILSPRLTSLKVYVSSSAEPIEIIFNDESRVAPLQESNWLIVDPDSQTLTRKLYTSKLYSQLFARSKSDPHRHLTDERMMDATIEFCFHLFDNSLPLPNDDVVEDWKSVFELVPQTNGLGLLACFCCITPTRWNSSDCYGYKSICGGLRLLEMMHFIN